MLWQNDEGYVMILPPELAQLTDNKASVDRGHTDLLHSSVYIGARRALRYEKQAAISAVINDFAKKQSNFP